MVGLLSIALGGVATLHVGVHQRAGSLYAIAADGADGQCSVLGMARIACPASGPVTFRWGGDAGYALTGTTVVRPGEVGQAFVLPLDGSQEAWRAKLIPATPEAVREVFLRTADREVPVPSPALFGDLVALCAHPDWRIRREAVRGLTPFVRHTASDAFPADAPSLLPDGLLPRLAHDREARVRRAVARLVREMHVTDPRADEARAIASQYAGDGDRRVRRLSTTLASAQAAEGMTDPLEAWQEALSRVERPGAPGRAACKALAQLRPYLEPGSVDADRALALVLSHHPENAWRVWSAWRREVPLHAGRLRLLLDTTVNLSLPLLRHWARTDPVALAEVLAAWEPSEPHSRRFQVIVGWLAEGVEEPTLRAALGLDDTLSDSPEPPPEE